MTPTLLWFRQDLRLQDNPALQAALVRGGPVVPVYVLDDAGEGRWPAGGATRWWLHHSLNALETALRERGSRLVLARGDSAAELHRLAAETGAGAVYWNRRYEPAATARDAKIKADLAAAGLEAKSFNGALLHEPHTIANKQGRPFQVFTPYWRHCLTLPVAAPVKLAAGPLPAPAKWPMGDAPAAWALLPKIKWDAGFGTMWQPGEAAAQKRLKGFAAAAMAAYSDRRNFPGVDGTSMLSPALHFGELSPRQIWAAVQAESRESGVFPPTKGAAVFLSEVGWREFAHHLMFHFPHTPERPLREDFARFPWAEDADGKKLRAWQRGRTGYPIVDAGMRQLWHTGWMHNRVRMIVASFLVKHLRLNWTAGAAWFWDTLVDADLAANTLGWQWSAGCGADAAPYFRIFAPVLQGQKFDPEGDYVRRWVPELKELPTKYLHAPWEAPPLELSAAGVRLGQTYPRPIVDHAKARNEALAAFKSIRGGETDER
ncbi:MAG: deoxyribodipyrimidine photolyase [Opitutia bacterium Tous-C1TDCM]|nr:MAG: deoxyribodipyrimidine photolyase [Opitutae bacterium Tous-C1TDCM]